MLVYYVLSWGASHAGNKFLACKLLVDGTEDRNTREIVGSNAAYFWGSTSSLWMGNLGQGTHTFAVQCRNGGATQLGANVDWANKAIQVLAL